MNEAEKRVLAALKESIVNSKEVVIELPYGLFYLFKKDPETNYSYINSNGIEITENDINDLEINPNNIIILSNQKTRTIRNERYYLISGKVVVFK